MTLMRRAVVCALILLPAIVMGEAAAERKDPDARPLGAPEIFPPLESATQVIATETAKQDPVPGAPKDSPSLKGRWGIGADLGSKPGLFVRRWLGENLAFDIGAGGTRDASNATYSWGESDMLVWQAYGIVGAKHNLWRPHPVLLIQGLARYEYGQEEAETKSFSTSSSILTVWRTKEEYSRLFLGLGFELLIPFCKSLSVEGNLGVMATYSESRNGYRYEPQVVPPEPDRTTRRSTIGISDSGMSPWSLINGKLTYYF